jgi:GT2 family glycosyltransferase
LDKVSPLTKDTDLPLVSICIPAYNSELTLAETLESVLALDYPNLDVVVSDNQSTDRTKEIVLKYADRGVRYCRHDAGRPSWAATLPNYIGGFTNWDFVLSQGRGEYLCLFHSDDLYEPSIIRQEIELMLAYPHVGAVFTRSRMVGEDGRPIKMGLSTSPEELNRRLTLDFATLLNLTLAHHNFLMPSSVMLQRSVIEKVGNFDEQHFFTSADLEMWMRIAQHGYEIGYINQPLLKYRISQRQFGGQYQKVRTTVADFFIVLDHFLVQPAVQTLAKAESVEIYELQRAADRVLCAMNLLTQSRINEALSMLDAAIQTRHFLNALKRPRLFARLVVGACLQVGTYLGVGHLMGRLVYYLYQQDVRRRRTPVSS